MSEIRSQFPSYIPLFKNIVGQYLSNFDSRTQISFLTDTVGLSIYSLKNPAVYEKFGLDKYAEVQSDVLSAKSMKKVGLDVHETSAFDFSKDRIDYLHPSGNSINLVITDSPTPGGEKNYNDEEILIVAQYLILLSKTLHEYKTKFGSEMRVFDNLEVVEFEKGVFGIRDTNLKNYIHPVFMQVKFNL